MNKFEFIVHEKVTPLVETKKCDIFEIEKQFIVSVSQQREVQPVRTFGGEVLDFITNFDFTIIFILSLNSQVGCKLLKMLTTENPFVLYEQKKFWVVSYENKLENSKQIWILECRHMQ